MKNLVAAALAVMLVLAVVPWIGMAVLNYQADECSVLLNGQQQILRGDACSQSDSRGVQ